MTPYEQVQSAAKALNRNSWEVLWILLRNNGVDESVIRDVQWQHAEWERITNIPDHMRADE